MTTATTPARGASRFFADAAPAGVDGGSRPVLEVDAVTRIYASQPPVTALRDVSFAVGEGELVAVVGPSGSGKTTLLSLMGTLDRPTTGTVHITGLEVSALSDRELATLRATSIGFVFQQFFLVEHQTVIDNVADGLLYAGVPLSERRRLALHALDLVRLAERPQARPTQLSGGQRQRVAIARAVVGRPAIVLADEPTGNLDQATGQSILALIDQLHQEGTTIVVVTHDQNVAARIPRRIDMLDGRIIADTTRATSNPPSGAHQYQRGPGTVEDVPGRSRPLVAAMTTAILTPRRLRPSDLGRLSAVGLHTRKLRATLSASGIAIGVAAIVAVLGLSSSSQAGLLNEISKLGTNLLTVTNGQTFNGRTAELPKTAPAMISRIGPVSEVQETGSVNGNVYRSPYIPTIETNALGIDASSLDLPSAVSTTVAQGEFLNAATAQEPVAVLGYAAAQRLGIDRIYPGQRIWVGGMWFYVAGIINHAVLAPEIDSAVLIGFPAAENYLGFDGHPSTIYVLSQTSQVNDVHAVLAATANPEYPYQVDMSQPSAALVAQAKAKGALNSLFLGLGAVSLLVGAVGVGNIMLIGVIERRSEIGLRRALGAAKGHIRIQFLTEAILLALVGGAFGVGAGSLATVIYANTHHWPVVIPALAWGGGIAAALIVGAVAGLLPALRAARMSPTEALWSL